MDVNNNINSHGDSQSRSELNTFLTNSKIWGKSGVAAEVCNKTRKHWLHCSVAGCGGLDACIRGS